MTVVADAGPLIALAKIGALDILFRLYPKVLIPPAVHREAIATGVDRGAPDALALLARWQAGDLETAASPDGPLPVVARLGRGEISAILLAIQRRAEWVLIDDLAARQTAERSFRAAQVTTGVKGTLGVIVSAFRAGHLSAPEGIDLVGAIGGRPDIWIHEQLRARVIESLREAP